VVFAGPYPLQGVIEWLSPAEGGRQSGPPADDGYAQIGWRESDGSVQDAASIVLRGFDPTQMTSPASAGWLSPEIARASNIKAGDNIVIAEGTRPVARFHVHRIDSPPPTG
jgi:hypothetical protein